MSTKINPWAEPTAVTIRNNEVGRGISAAHLDLDEVTVYAGHKIQHLCHVSPLRIVAGSGTTYTIELLVSPFTDYLHFWLDTRVDVPNTNAYIDISSPASANTSRLYFSGNQELETGEYQSAVNDLPQHLLVSVGAAETLVQITLTPSVAPAPAYNARIVACMVEELCYNEHNRNLI